MPVTTRTRKRSALNRPRNPAFVRVGTSARGLSLLETLIALFIIVVALLMMTQLMHTSLRRGNASEQRLRAALCAQETLEEIRLWAANPDNFESTWSTYDNQTLIDPIFPEMQIRTTVADRVVATPSKLLEDDFPIAEQRLLEEACKRVTVECRWGNGPKDALELVTLVSAPPRAFRTTDPIEITPTAGSLEKDESASFTARAFDDRGQEIKGITFHWYILPKTGNATLVAQTRDGRESTIGHWLLALDGVTRVYATGQCDLVVRARYNGITETGSVEIELQ